MNGRPLAWCAFLLVVLCIYVWMRRLSPRFAWVFAVGFVTRAALGLALFYISLRRLPIMRSLQLGGGFWTLALDGRSYFELASRAAATTLTIINDDLPSPTYVRVLAVWLRAFGATPLSAILFNLACYLAFTVLVLIASRRENGRNAAAPTLTLASLIACPSLLLFGTQPLKDTLCVLLITSLTCGFALWTVAMAYLPINWTGVGGGMLLMALAVYGTAGIRPYFAVFMIVATVAAMIWSKGFFPVRHRWWAAGADVALVVVLWLAFMTGGGPYYRVYTGYARNIMFRDMSPIVPFDTARASFIASGGATSLEMRLDAREFSPGLNAVSFPERRPGFVGRLSATVRGCAAMVVPISVLRALSIVTFSGGRGLLLVTDIDTIVMDLTAICCIVWLTTMGRWRTAYDPTLVLIVLLAAMTGIAMAYVVTNFGTLFRLRLLVFAPLWLIPALASRFDARAETLVPADAVPKRQ